MPQVSVIIPVYGVEQFIARCAESLMRQSLQEVEYIFVDDATPDHSMEVLAEVLANYPQRAEQVKILVHEVNKGLPAARNTGLAVVTGDYIFHCDSDDFLEPDALETLHRKAMEEDADMVWCDWSLSFGKSERYMVQPSYATAIDALKAMLGGAMKYNVWNKLVRRSLYTNNGVTFPAGYAMGEDMTMLMLMACASRVAYVPQALYHYVKSNTNATTASYTDTHLAQLRYNVSKVEAFLSGRHVKGIENELAFFKLEAKFPLLSMDGKKYRQLWKEWWPEAHAYILKDRYTSRRRRWLQWCAAHNLWLLVSIYHVLLDKLFYGILYR